ncbi:MAG: isoaspartyl peptidase/L-asparaginase [Candidatus Moduliflexus flocculans]|nr:isoaspartyl peptidase/L-asparaginase [Candidatus Moduliflexus flocculans]
MLLRRTVRPRRAAGQGEAIRLAAADRRGRSPCRPGRGGARRAGGDGPGPRCGPRLQPGAPRATAPSRRTGPCPPTATSTRPTHASCSRSTAAPGPSPTASSSRTPRASGWLRRAASEALAGGAPPLRAVLAALRVMEDDPTFDAGTGSFLNEDGEVELDAAVMEGRGLEAGAVASIGRFRNPSEIALAVMERTEHVLLIGAGAERFALSQGFAPVDSAEPGPPAGARGVQRPG